MERKGEIPKCNRKFENFINLFSISKLIFWSYNYCIDSIEPHRSIFQNFIPLFTSFLFILLQHIITFSCSQMYSLIYSYFLCSLFLNGGLLFYIQYISTSQGNSLLELQYYFWLLLKLCEI